MVFNSEVWLEVLGLKAQGRRKGSEHHGRTDAQSGEGWDVCVREH